MADLNRKRARKSKLVLRQCEDDNLQIPPKKIPTESRPPIQFDIKVEIESCDEDSFDLNSYGNDIKTEIKTEVTNENDLFEAEEHDINQLALALSKKNDIEKVVKKERDCDVTVDDERDINALATALIEKKNAEMGKRKRVPNIKKEYIYSMDDVDDEEHDVNALASMLGGSLKKNRKTPKKKKPNTIEKLDINTKMKLWKSLDVNDDDEDDVDDEYDDDVKDDVFGSTVNKVGVKKEPDGNDESNSDVEYENSSNKSATKDIAKIDTIDPPMNLHQNLTFPKTKLGMSTMRQLKISDEAILKELEKLSPKLTEPVDKILEIEMRNSWGRVRHTLHVTTSQQKKIQNALDEWRYWSGSSKNREPPAMYKCYICERAWWHFRQFSDHLSGHKEDLKVEIEINFQECFIVAFQNRTVPKYFPVDGNCWRCGNDLFFHSMATSTKPGKNYGCDNCGEGFGSCRMLREHQGKCTKSLLKLVEAIGLAEIKLTSCTICTFKVLNTGTTGTCEEMLKHMKVYHSVRSDLPSLEFTKKCKYCTQPYPLYSFHKCPNRNRKNECQYCNRRFPSQVALEVHLSTTEINFKCRICGLKLLKQCMETLHLVEHSRNFGIMYKCITCVENILLLDSQSMKKHKVIWHKQKFDRRRNYFETMLVPKELIEKHGMEKLDIVTSFQNVKFMESKKGGSPKLVNLDNAATPNKVLDNSDVTDEQGDVLFVDETSQNSEVIELDDDDESLIENDNENDIEVEIDAASELDEEFFEITKANIKKESNINIEEVGYETMLTKVLNGKLDDGMFENGLKTEVVDTEIAERDVKQHVDVIENQSEMDAASNKKQIFKCSKCLRAFEKMKGYCEHLALHGYDPKSCPECLDTYPSYADLEKHIKSRMRSILLRMQYIQRSAGSGAELVIRRQCRKCKQEVQLKDMFAHWESHLEVGELTSPLEPKVELEEDNDEGGSPNGNGQEEDTRPLTPEKLKQVIAAILIKKSGKECVVCDRVFDRMNDTKRHLIEHLLQDAYFNKIKHKALRCQICHDAFVRSDEYKLHVRAHAGMPVHQCAQCGKTFCDSSNYCKHVKTHAGAAAACRVCGKRFMQLPALQRHMQIHESGPIQCLQCPKLCYGETAYSHHMRHVHDKCKRRYRCVICKKRFRSVRERLDHSWTEHKERKRQVDCALCAQPYRKLTELKSHLKTIHDINPSCAKPFIKASSGTVTSGPFNCPICGSVSATTALLASHLVEVHRHYTRMSHKGGGRRQDSPAESASEQQKNSDVE